MKKLAFPSAALRGVGLAAIALAVVAGCGGSERVCVDAKEPYLHARDNPHLRVPEGMSSPNRSEALAIPDAQGRSPAGRTACLDEPPSYFRSSGTVARSPEEVIASWGQAWANREADAVLELYSSSFVAPTEATGTAKAWLEQRREQVAVGPVPEPMVENLRVEPDGADRRIVTFVQRFATNSLRKELVLVREAGSWRIASEKVVELK